jgi:hypothetical protein
MIRKFLDLSPAHLSPDTRAWLDEQGRLTATRRTVDDPDCLLAMGSMPHGWFVHADTEACKDVAAFNRLLERRNVLVHSYGDDQARNGAIRDAIIDVDRNIANLISEPSPDIPADLWACFARANAEGCEYVMFDADAPELDALRTFPEDYVENNVVVIFPLGARV